jgi:hypothetical protein
VTGVYRKLHDEEHCEFYLSRGDTGDHIKDDKMGGVCSILSIEKKCT